MSLRSKALISIATAAIFLQICPAGAQNQRNLILFVPDGLRPYSVTPDSTPALAAVRDKGVNFTNPHALFPTFTMANATGMARVGLRPRWSARCDILMRRAFRAVPLEWMSAKQPAADIGEKSFSIRRLSAKALFSAVRNSRRWKSLCPVPYSSAAQATILGAKCV
jgi:Type I phosphodiesterase / nucleotide pyrophosphatase